MALAREPQIRDPANAIAASLCWLARQPGLPTIHELRVAVARRHATNCRWCDTDADELLALVEAFNQSTERQVISGFTRMSINTQRAAVAKAQSPEQVP
jgi:hypothetical protein